MADRGGGELRDHARGLGRRERRAVREDAGVDHHELGRRARLAAEHCPDGHRVIANQGSNSGQLVPHFHAHILGGRRLGALVPEA